MKNVTIKRSKWQRGGSYAVETMFNIPLTTLWDRENDCGCCLGHILHQAHGVPYVDLDSQESPDILAITKNKKNPLVDVNNDAGHNKYTDSVFSNAAIKFNDEDYMMTDELREESITSLGLVNGYTITFED